MVTELVSSTKKVLKTVKRVLLCAICVEEDDLFISPEEIYKSSVKNDFADKFLFGVYAHYSYYTFPDKKEPFVEFKEMGLDYSFETPPNNITDMGEMLQEAHNAGIKLLYNGTNYTGLGYTSRNKFHKKLDENPEMMEAFMGLIAYDEPSLEGSKNVSWVDTNIIKPFNEEYPGLHCFINCLPNYAQGEQLKDGRWENGRPYATIEEYEDYVRKVANTDTDIVIGDFYGPYDNIEQKDLWIPYLETMRKISLETGKEMWQYISSSCQGTKKPTEDTLKYRIYLNLMYGAQSIIMFKIKDYNSTDSPYSEDNKKQETYYVIQKLLADENSEVRRISSFFKNSKIEYVNVINDDNDKKYITSNVKKNGREYLCVFGYDDVDATIYASYEVLPNGDVIKHTVETEHIKKGELKIYIK